MFFYADINYKVLTDKNVKFLEMKCTCFKGSLECVELAELRSFRVRKRTYRDV